MTISIRFAMRGIFRCAAALACALGSRAAFAQVATKPVTEALDVTSSTCLDRASVAGGVAAWLGRKEIDARLRITVRESASGEATYSVRRDGVPIGERTLHVTDVSCADRRSAVALGIAIAIDATVLDTIGVAPTQPPRVETQPPVVPPPPPPTATTSLPPPPPPPARPREAEDRRERAGEPPEANVSAALEGVVLVGVLPNVTLGIAPSIDVRLARSFDARASALVSTATSVPLGQGSAEVRLAAGRLDGCAALRAGAAHVRGCVGVAAGVVDAAGTGYPVAYTNDAPWIGPVLRIDGRWTFGRTFGIVLSVDGSLPGIRPRLDVVARDGSVVASRTFPLAGVLVGLGPSLAFW